MSRCNPDSPKSLIIVDNLDQQPTESIEQIVGHLHDLDARQHGVRLLIPLRPSSIVPHGFTNNASYMYHYGPNCFELVYRRLAKSVLTQPRARLIEPNAAVFASTPTDEEVNAFLVACYLYAAVCLGGMEAGSERAAANIAGVRPAVHPEHEFLHRVRLSARALRQLADTLEAVIGTCGRYATDQLRRFFYQVYSNPEFLLQVERAGLPQGGTVALTVPYGQVVTAMLGVGDADSGVTGLANLYSPTEATVNIGLPSTVKLRILLFLVARHRVTVREVLAVLAHFGIPSDIAIGGLNYLHEKNRLLVWFSRNANLTLDSADYGQYVVISEHGSAYVRELLGDFEYLWFCGSQLGAGATTDSPEVFRVRLGEYRRLLTDLASIEWKQMTFRFCAATTAWSLPTADIKRDEMISLFVLYSSLARLLGVMYQDVVP